MGASYASTVLNLDGKGTRKEQINRAWGQAHDDAAYSDGVEYSGNFGSKSDYPVVIAEAETAPKSWAANLNLLAEGGQDDWWKTIRRDQPCRACYGREVTMKVVVRVLRAAVPLEQELVPKASLKRGAETVASIARPCRKCGGTGTEPLPADQIANQEAAVEAVNETLKALGITEARRKRLVEVTDDKWGPAAAVRVGDKVWFGGYCSS